MRIESIIQWIIFLCIIYYFNEYILPLLVITYLLYLYKFPSKYGKSNGFNSKTFANAIGIKCRTVEAWSRGERLPRWQDAKKIFVFTDNKVTGQDLYDEQIQKQETILQRDKVRQ